ncbi:MAG: hypothetical protein IPH07_12675 [Deltaproteobacteria bacterium]|nr:hypothetical protein [Deltaproteobacteria bacterium]MBK8241357.1 hypothetical protein [Deltaproteobacteria bacterium]MBK8717073.1 hypothetical protein [Deltaproteobacteria bacterium]MBP7286404.1 hypothetical protein [Nannocystaceae bacterium]
MPLPLLLIPLLGAAACEQETSDAIESLAAEVAEAHGVENYAVEVVATLAELPDQDAEDNPSGGAPVDGLASAPIDPEELKQMWCGEYGDGCVVCVLTLGECSFWADNCGGGAYNTCN